MRRPPKQLSLKECYDILKVDKNVTLEDVKHAYRRRAFELHPDLNPGNPDASHQFQLLNEAYVALSAILEASANSKASKDSAHTNNTENKNSEKSDSTGTAGAASSTRGKRQNTQSNAYREEDVLRDLLQDPFARRVFEDIYSELHKKQAAPPPPPPPPGDKAKSTSAKPNEQKKRTEQQKRNVHDTTRLHQGNLAWDTPNWNSQLNKGVKGAVKGWLRRQIDEEQSLTIPKAGLVPGQRIRLQIRQGLSGELKTVEITLPQDFVPGKAVRLKGLGKRVGPWQGDLYLTLRGN